MLRAPSVRGDVRQIAVSYPFDDGAASFASSSRVLNDVWELCRYSIKATTFCGVYVDGDRERIPYEGDAYINQLGHYCVDREFTLARSTHEYLLDYPTWPTEWASHSVLMAWADYLYTGTSSSIEAYYDEPARQDAARPGPRGRAPRGLHPESRPGDPLEAAHEPRSLDLRQEARGHRGLAPGRA